MDWVGNVAYGVRLPYNFLSTPQWHAAFEQAGLGKQHWNEKLGLDAAAALVALRARAPFRRADDARSRPQTA